ncbi:hypothetical protein BJX65DRAFT_268345 [Aspergillus insuetus]
MNKRLGCCAPSVLRGGAVIHNSRTSNRKTCRHYTMLSTRGIHGGARGVYFPRVDTGRLLVIKDALLHR